MKNSEGKISATTWITWLAAVLTVGLTLSAYAFTQFSTKAEVEKYNGSVEKRLDRIEIKVDDILKKLPRG